MIRCEELHRHEQLVHVWSSGTRPPAALPGLLVIESFDGFHASEISLVYQAKSQGDKLWRNVRWIEIDNNGLMWWRGIKDE